MSQIKPTHLLISLAMALALVGCGDKNDKAVLFTPESGHPSDWVAAHKTSAQANVESCMECHSEDYKVGVSISKVSCFNNPTAVSGFSCHATSPVANLTGCISCHGGLPSGPSATAGSVNFVAPNRQFAHAEHTALPGVGCDICHFKAGSGTAGHDKALAAGGFKSATVTLQTAFKAFSTSSNHSSTFNNYAVSGCSSVSCHGGKTIAWTDSIDIKADCNKCHEQGTSKGNPQYNSYYTGGHYSHLNVHAIKATCTNCHNIGTLTDFQLHFGGITTNTLILPSRTIGGAPTTIVAVPPATGNGYDPATTKCTTACHHSTTFNYLWIQP